MAMIAGYIITAQFPVGKGPDGDSYASTLRQVLEELNFKKILYLFNIFKTLFF